MGWQERFIRARRNRHKSEAQLALQQLLLQGDGGVTTYGVVTENLLDVSCGKWTTSNVTCSSNGQAVRFQKTSLTGPGKFEQNGVLDLGVKYTVHFKLTDAVKTDGSVISWTDKANVVVGGVSGPVKDQAGIYSFTATATTPTLGFSMSAACIGSIQDIVLVKA